MLMASSSSFDLDQCTLDYIPGCYWAYGKGDKAIIVYVSQLQYAIVNWNVRSMHASRQSCQFWP